MPILAMQAGDSQNNSAHPTGEVLIESKVEDIQKKRNSDYIILDAGIKRVLLQMTDMLNILPGDTLIIWGKLKMSQSPRNPGEIDYGGYLQSQGIQAIFHRDFSIMEIIEDRSSVNRWFFMMRKGIHHRLTEAVGHPYAGLVASLLLGENQVYK